MSAKKHNMMESVRSQWMRQRSGGSDAPRGSHFAKPGAPAAPVSQETGEDGPSSPSPMGPGLPTPDFSHALMAASPDDSLANMPAVAQEAPQTAGEPAASGQQGAQRHIRITGASGEMPAVPLRVKRSPAIPYSRYNKRYLTDGPKMDLETAFGAFANEPMEGAPAYGWKPFAVYGIASVALSLVWGVAVKVAVPGQLSADSFEVTLGVALLCATVVAGIALFAATTAMTRRNVPDSSSVDVAASALGKTSLMMVAGVAMWVLASFVVTNVSL